MEAEGRINPLTYPCRNWSGAKRKCRGGISSKLQIEKTVEPVWLRPGEVMNHEVTNAVDEIDSYRDIFFMVWIILLKDTEVLDLALNFLETYTSKLMLF